ncbi:hypothetical protein [Lysobacter sp. CA199]|uniref:hypothetical protein n=1 Tax=Lysobacter sp. CA199 TaxID=3455608 RepID=UPI003F8D2CCE
MQTPPTSSPAPAVPFNPVLPGIGLLIAFACGIAPIWVVPQFEQVFVSFGADLPAATRLMVDYPWVLSALPVPVLAVWALAPKRWRDLLACVAGVVLGMAAVGFTVWAMYLPIFMLGATI